MKAMKFHRAGIHLPVKNLRQTLDYYRDVLGFYEEWTWGKSDGGIRRDDMRLLFGEDHEYTAAINGNKKCINLMWFVDNITEVFEEFRMKKITIVSPLTNYPYGMREFAFFDINGYYIRVAESIEEQENA